MKDKNHSNSKRFSSPGQSGVSTTPIIKKNENRIQARKSARIIPIQSIASHPNAEILRSVHVARLIECRAFEIEKLTEALSKAEAMSKARAFQKVPRFLRRRAASHNPKKVPIRFRKQAAQELALAQSTLKRKVTIDPRKLLKKKKKTLQKLKRRILRTNIKHWIPTHVWHAKRFHMLSIWDLKIPGTPTQKCARAFYRASQHHVVGFDRSYMKLYICRGARDHLTTLLRTFVPSLPYTSRYCEGWVHTDGPEPHLVAPLSVMWMDASTVWMYLHPLAEVDVLDTLREKMKHAHLPVHIEELTHLGLISLHGPKTLGLLQATLKIANQADEKVAEFWKQLHGVIDPASLPKGVALELNVWDPRLSYPPSRPNYVRSDASRTISQSILEQPWPSFPFTLHHSPRPPLRKPAWSTLNRRRSHALIPGTPLTPDPNLDTPFRILLFTDLHSPGFHLVVPRAYTLPFWRTLVYAGARPGGLTQYRSLFQAHQPMYPFDYPDTRGYRVHAAPMAERQMAKWQRTPAGKRVNHAALGISHPFLPNWKAVHPAHRFVRVFVALVSGMVNEHAVVYNGDGKTVIGFVTTGGMCFERGRCVAWASVDARVCLTVGSKVQLQHTSRPVLYVAKVERIINSPLPRSSG